MEVNQSRIHNPMAHTNPKTFPKLTTENLNLRQLSHSDVHEIFRLRSDVSINKYLDRPPSKTQEDALKFIEAIRINSRTYWAITLKGSKKLLGTVCLFDLFEQQKKCEIGYELLPEHQGKGIMQEATNKIIEYALQTLGIKTIIAHPHKDNQSSIKLLNKLEFEKLESGLPTNTNLCAYWLKK